MSVGVAWFPDYGHIVAVIFLLKISKLQVLGLRLGVDVLTAKFQIQSLKPLASICNPLNLLRMAMMRKIQIFIYSP